jgi:hypothetical protein
MQHNIMLSHNAKYFQPKYNLIKHLMLSFSYAHKNYYAEVMLSVFMLSVSVLTKILQQILNIFL